MALFVRVKLCRHLGKAKAHVNYIAFRSRESLEERRGAFDRHRNHADVHRFSARLEDHLTRHPMANKVYKLTISLSEREFNERGLWSWKPVVREAMDNLQEKWGRQFEWIASEHMAKGHPHVHIVIKATCRDEYGRQRQLRLDPEHMKDIKGEFGRILERDRPRELERSLDISRADTLFRAFDALVHSFIRHEQDSRAEAEYLHQRWLRQRSRDDDRGR